MSYNDNSFIIFIFSKALKTMIPSLDQFHSDKENLSDKDPDVLDNIHELPIH